MFDEQHISGGSTQTVEKVPANADVTRTFAVVNTALSHNDAQDSESLGHSVSRGDNTMRSNVPKSSDRRGLDDSQANGSELHGQDLCRQLYEKLKSVIGGYYRQFDFGLLDKAYDFAYAAHDGQMRVAGEPYIIHPLQVAIILAGLELDITSIVAGLLHDVVEDTNETLNHISELFGSDVARIVDGVTKLEKIPYTSKEEQQAENIRKMFLAMSKDLRVILIKLADRLHNMRTMGDMSPEHSQRKARETLEIFSPLANRLGIFKLQSELEDLSFRYLEPQAYADLVVALSDNRFEREAPIAEIAGFLGSRLREMNIDAHIEYRMKHMYSVYRKMISQNKQLDQIYDIYAVRIIVGMLGECYAALGKVHEEYKPIPGRFKDYIAVPKHNQYQSLHTTLIGETGIPFEVQIRTWEMHRIAEFGIAAHWRYKESGTDGGKDTGSRANIRQEVAGRDGPSGRMAIMDSGLGGNSAIDDKDSAEGIARDGSMTRRDNGGRGIFELNENDKKLAWLRQLIEWQRDMQDAGDFVENLPIDLYTETVFVFSPKGDVYDLPFGSTPIDFAYRVHSAIGNRMNGARVNGRIVPISYVLQNGDIVEIITSSAEHGPSRDWLDIVKSSQAKTKIKQWFKRENREENIVRGKELFEREIKRQGYTFQQLMRPEWVDRLLKRYNFNSVDDAYSAVGYEGISSIKLVFRLVDEYKAANRATEKLEQLISLEESAQKKEKAERSEREKSPESGILVKGIGNCLVRLSHCCNPVPGDPIIGYITRARGVSVHRADCVNAISGVDDENRLVEVSWYDGILETYPALVTIMASDRASLMMDITSTLSALHISLKAINAKVSRSNYAMIDLTVVISDKSQLEGMISKLNSIESIIKVTRGHQ